ncbi:MAG TPA: SPOR domain-containing protein [Bacteroidia bacterium]|jgi:hypothetical protein
MLKYISVAFILFISGAIHSQEITAIQKIPASAMPGTDFIVETIVNRGSSATGFMKFFQELPTGFTAVDIESKGGSFTFADGGAKIVWITPPSDPTFTISYRVTVAGGMSGMQNMPCKIAYISNNERKTFEFEPKSIMIGTATVPVKKEIPSNPPPTTQTTTAPVKTPPATNPPVTTTAPVKKDPPPPPVKKDPVTPTQPATFSKVPASALPSSTGKMYRVQIGAFAAKPKIEGVPEVTTVVLENGITKYFSGNYSTYEEAVKRKKEMIDKGFQGAFIVAFENGKIVK